MSAIIRSYASHHSKIKPPSIQWHSTIINNNNNRFAIPSIGFSGAGFLGAYHVGVASCLLKHQYLLKPMERQSSSPPSSPILAGVSAGALIAAAISAGVTTDDAMNVLYEINSRTKEKSNFILSSFTPGFSLIDQVEDLLMKALQVALGGSKSDHDYDNELLMHRIDHGRLLHIGLTDRRSIIGSMSSLMQNATRNTLGGMSSNSNITGIGERSSTISASSTATKEFLIKGNLNMYVHVSKYRNLKDVVSAALLSSYVPIGTGPLYSNEPNTKNTTVKSAFQTLKEMEDLGFLKHGVTGKTINVSMYDNRNSDDGTSSSMLSSSITGECYFWDGGLVNMFPCIDKSTLMVTPLHCKFSNPFIAPVSTTDNSHYINIDDNVSMGMNMQNLRLFRKMLRHSDPLYLDEMFRNGYDDTTKYLKENNLLRAFH